MGEDFLTLVSRVGVVWQLLVVGIREDAKGFSVAVVDFVHFF